MNLIIGDSHILALQKFNNEKNELHEFSASSIRGLLNRKSKSKTGIKIIKLLRRKTFDKLLFSDFSSNFVSLGVCILYLL